MQAALSSKQAAGRAAAQMVEDGMVLGLGTGSTFEAFLEALELRIRAEGLSVVGIPTSERTAGAARAAGIQLASLNGKTELDLVFDGADEVDRQFRMIKGGGGALLREKMVASAGKRVVIMIGENKRVERLGTSFLLPVEVLPFAQEWTAARVEAFGCQAFFRTMEDGTSFVTDNGNSILDCKFESGISDPEALQSSLSQTPGVAEVGLFLGLCDCLIEGLADGGVRVEENPSAGR